MAATVAVPVKKTLAVLVDANGIAMVVEVQYSVSRCLFTLVHMNIFECHVANKPCLRRLEFYMAAEGGVVRERVSERNILNRAVSRCADHKAVSIFPAQSNTCEWW